MKTQTRTLRLDTNRSLGFVILCFLAWASSYAQGQKTETLKPFSQVEVAGHFELLLEQGTDYSLEMKSADADEIDRYEVEQEGDVLRIIRQSEARDGKKEKVVTFDGPNYRNVDRLWYSQNTVD